MNQETMCEVGSMVEIDDDDQANVKVKLNILTVI